MMSVRALCRLSMTVWLLVTLATVCPAQQDRFAAHFQKATASYKEERFDAARQAASEARKSATNADQRQRVDRLLASIDAALERHRSASQLANRVGLTKDEPSAEALADHSNDVNIDAERLGQTLAVFVRDQGGQVIEGALTEFQCRDGNPRIVVVADAKPVALEIDNPNDILITRASKHTTSFDFRCGKQKGELVRVGYRPARQDGREGFVRILQFEK